jgi:hypothetical protein
MEADPDAEQSNNRGAHVTAQAKKERELGRVL